MDKVELTIAFKALALGTLPPLARRVGAALLEHFNRHTGRCDPSIETLAVLLDVNSRSIIRATNQLVSEGYFKRYRHGGHFNCNQYEPIWARFNQVNDEWCSRRKRHSERFAAPKLSPKRWQTSHLSGDRAVTQTSLSNLSYVTSSSSTSETLKTNNNSSRTGTSEDTAKNLIPKSSQQHFHGKQTSSSQAALNAAERRWITALDKRFVHDALYVDLIRAIDTKLSAAATAAEMSSPGSGLPFVLDALRDRGVALGTSAEANQEKPP
jgi:hypothetical protein